MKRSVLRQLQKAKQQEIIKTQPKVGLLKKLNSAVDRTTLSFYQYMGGKAELLKQKIEDPDGYEADRIVEDAEKFLIKLQKRILQGKEPTKSRLQVLSAYCTALTVIEQKKLGKLHIKASIILEDLISQGILYL